MKSEINMRINKIISDTAAISTGFSDAASLKEELGLDSLSLAGLIIALEDEFAIRFDDGDLDPAKLSTAGSLAELVRKYV